MKNQAVFLYKLINQEMGVSPPPFFSRSKKKGIQSHATLNSRLLGDVEFRRRDHPFKLKFVHLPEFRDITPL